MLRISALSTEYVLLPIKAKSDGAPIDVTTDAVSMAIVAPGTDPGALDWQAADWEVDAVAGVTYARLLVGPDGGAVAPAPGRWHAWVRVTDNPETPVIDGGPLEIY